MILLDDGRICMTVNDRLAVNSNYIIKDALTVALNYVLETNDYLDKMTDDARITVTLKNSHSQIYIFGYLGKMTDFIEHVENFSVWERLVMTE